MDDADPTRRYQSSLWNLLALVMGSAVFLGLTRGTTRIWWTSSVAPGVWRIDVDRLIGVALLAPAILIGAVLVASMIALGRPPSEGRGAIVFGVAWRLVGLMYLVAMGRGIADQLRTLDEPELVFGFVAASPLRMKIVALSASIGLAGVLLGVVSIRARDRPHRVRSSTATVVLAGVAGVLFLACWDVNICYLVLIALDAVSNAMHRPGEMAVLVARGGRANALLTDPGLWRSLHTRIMLTGLEAALSLVFCMITARWLGRDLRRGPVRREAPWSAIGVLYRMITAVGTWGMGLWLMFGAIPYLHPALTEGGHTLLYPWGTSVIVAGFVVLSAGLAARGVATIETEPSDDTTRPTHWSILPIKLVFASGLILLILAAFSRIQGNVFLPWYGPASLREWIETVRNWLTFRTATAVYLDPAESPEALVLIVGVIGIIVASLRSVLGRSIGESPIDRIGRSPRLIGRWVGAWLAMLGVMFTLFPALFLAAIAVVHLSVRLSH